MIQKKKFSDAISANINVVEELMGTEYRTEPFAPYEEKPLKKGLYFIWDGRSGSNAILRIGPSAESSWIQTSGDFYRLSANKDSITNGFCIYFPEVDHPLISNNGDYYVVTKVIGLNLDKR